MALVLMRYESYCEAASHDLFRQLSFAPVRELICRPCSPQRTALQLQAVAAYRLV